MPRLHFPWRSQILLASARSRDALRASAQQPICLTHISIHRLESFFGMATEEAREGLQ
jgi:hypothetical protein